MSSFRGLKTVTTPCWLGIFLALAVFFLPLHFHVTLANAGQVAKECGCLHGTRTQLATAATAPQPALPIELTAVVIDKESSSNNTWSDPQKVRGPPSLPSR
jgi:hypothetical protein